jgi:hypothetical protein
VYLGFLTNMDAHTDEYKKKIQAIYLGIGKTEKVGY